MDESLVKSHVLALKRTKQLISVFIKIEKLFLKLKMGHTPTNVHTRRLHFFSISGRKASSK